MKAEVAKAIRTQSFLDAAKRAIELGDIDAAATEFEVSTSGLMNFMRSGTHMDEYKQVHGEIAMEKLATTGRRKGELAIQFADIVERVLTTVHHRLDNGQRVVDRDGQVHQIDADAQGIEQLMRAAGLATDKLQLILGDPTVIAATSGQIEFTESSHREVLERLAERAGILPPEPMPVAAVRDDVVDAEGVDSVIDG